MGALSLGFTFVADRLPGATVYLPNPIVKSQERVLIRSRVKNYTTYPYYDPKNKCLTVSDTLDFLMKVKDRSVVVLDAGSHNPTGLSMTSSEWDSMIQVFKKKEHLPLFSLMYQGLTTGDINNDAQVIRRFAKEGFQMIVAQSFSTNMGLYGERVGATHIVCSDALTAEKAISQIKIQTRRFYSAAPLHGARIFNRVVQEQSYFDMWQDETFDMHKRMKDIRKTLRELLVDSKTPGNWDHLLRQTGPHCDLGLTGTEFILEAIIF